MDQFDPNELDLQSLYASAQQSNEAKARALALRDKLAQAKEMQNTNYANQNPSPFGASYMGGLRDVFSNYRGASQQRKLQPQYEQAQVEGAEADTRFKLYEEAQKRAQQEELKRRWDAEYNARGPKTVYYNMEDPTQSRTVFGSKEHGFTDGQGNPIPVKELEGWTDDKSVIAGDGTYVPAGITGEANDAAFTLINGAKVFKDYLKIPSQDLIALDSEKKIVKKLLRSALTPDLFDQTVKQFRSNYSPETINFLRELNRMDAMTRYKLFGATLTKGEAHAAEQVMNLIEKRGITAALDTARQNMRRSYTIAKSYKDHWGKDLYSNELAEMGYTNPEAIWMETDHPSLSEMYVETLPPVNHMPPAVQRVLDGVTQETYLETPIEVRRWIQREINNFLMKSRQTAFGRESGLIPADEQQ